MERNLGKSLRLCRNVGLQRHDQDQEQLLLGYFHIPSELAVEMLRRLPIKSLLRFRCISKSWKSFLDSNYFIDSHLRRPLPGTAGDDDRLVAVVEACFDCGMNVVHKASFTKLFKFNPPEMHNKYPKLSFIGTCNGLICIQALIDHRGGNVSMMVYLWNPVKGVRIIHTRRFKGKSLTSQLPFTDYGIGYDSCNNEYKVVKLQLVVKDKPSKLYGYANKVYSLSTNSWRVIPSAPPSTSCPRPYSQGRPPPPLVNGATHWLADSSADINNTQLLQRARGTRASVISFNFHDEVFGEISLPISSSTTGTTLVSYKSSLAVMVPDRSVLLFDSPSFHLWVMREYGVAESWTKLYTIDSPKLNAFTRQPFVQFRGFGEDENELIFDACMEIPKFIRGVCFVKINCNSNPQPTFTSSSTKVLNVSEYPIVFRPSLVSVSSDVDIGA